MITLRHPEFGTHVNLEFLLTFDTRANLYDGIKSLKLKGYSKFSKEGLIDEITYWLLHDTKLIIFDWLLEELRLIKRLVDAGPDNYVEVPIPENEYYLIPRCYFVVTYHDEERNTYCLMMPDDVREACSGCIDVPLKIAERNDVRDKNKSLLSAESEKEAEIRSRIMINAQPSYIHLLDSINSLSMERQAVFYLTLFKDWQYMDDFGHSMIFDSFPPFMQDIEFLLKEVIKGNITSGSLTIDTTLLSKDLEMVCTIGERNKNHKEVSLDYKRLKYAITETLHMLDSRSDAQISSALTTVSRPYEDKLLPEIDFLGFMAQTNVLIKEVSRRHDL